MKEEIFLSGGKLVSSEAWHEKIASIRDSVDEDLFDEKKAINDVSKVVLHAILERIEFYRTDLISQKNKQKGYDLCKDIDVKDTLYVALVLEIGGRLWSDDKKLKRHLVKNGFTKFFEPLKNE